MDDNIRDIDVSDDYLLLDAIIDAKEITPKELARLCGVARTTMYAYLNGRSTIPVSVWRVVYELTGDGRITKLITGDLPHLIVSLNGGQEAIKDAGLIEMRRKQVEFESLMIAAMESRVDARKLEKAFMDMIGSQARAYQMYND